MHTADLSKMSRAEREFLSKKLEEKIFGDMTKTIVRFDTQNALDEKRYTVYKPEFIVDGDPKGEYDMLIYDRKDDSYFGFEVKHTDNPFLGFDKEGIYNGQDRNLLNKDIREVVDADFGHREHVFVLYNGMPFEAPTGTTFLNIADFLRSLDRTHDIKETSRELCEGIGIRGSEIFQNESHFSLDEVLKKNGIF